MLLLLKNLNNVNPWRVLGIGAGVAVLLMALYVKSLTVQLQRETVAYKNPMVKAKTRVVKVEGPVKIVTRIIRDPGGRVEEVRTEERGAVTTTTDSIIMTKPVALNIRTSGWVLGLGSRLASRLSEDFDFYGGYRFGGRLDILGRVNGGGKSGVVLLVRF